jgi:hypothetical protein
MEQEVHDMIYLLTPVKASVNRNMFFVPLVSYPCQSVLPPNYSGLPKSASHARLKEHIDDPDGTKIYPKYEIRKGYCMFPTSGRL